MKTSPQIHDQPEMFPREFPNPPVISRNAPYKGGGKIPVGKRFRNWRETDGKARIDIAKALFDMSRESTKEVRRLINLERLTLEYILDCVEELENSRYKPPTWLIVLIFKTYPQLNLPWWEFLDDARNQ